MSEFRLSFPACVIAGKNRLTTDDIAMLRRFTFPEGIRSSDDAVALLFLHSNCPEKCPEWSSYFVETLTEFVVHFSYPQGTLDETNAAWLRRMFATGGVVNSVLELELLLHVMEVSAYVPDSLTSFALDQLRLAVCRDSGAYVQMRDTRDAGITVDDLAYVHRILRGAFQRGHLTLSPLELDVLYEIDRGITDKTSHPGWHEMIALIRMRDPQADAPRRDRWLRVADELLLDPGVAA
jgi:hypothetical protein